MRALAEATERQRAGARCPGATVDRALNPRAWLLREEEIGRRLARRATRDIVDQNLRRSRRRDREGERADRAVVAGCVDLTRAEGVTTIGECWCYLDGAGAGGPGGAIE